MSSFGNIVISASKPGEVQWLMDISSEMFNTESYLESPTFAFSHCCWCVRMFPQGASFTQKNWISLFLRKANSQSEIHVEFMLEIALQDKDPSWRNTGHHTFHKNEDYYGWSLFLPRDDVLQHLAMKTQGCIQVTIKVRFPPSIPPTLFPPKVKKDVKQDIKTIRQDYKDMLLNDTRHDVILKVQDKEFKVHQTIMQFRCPVFMFAHDILERNRGVVEIPDCDPLAFKQFLFYVYTGTVETLDESVMLGLYYIADKYDMTHLKEKCCKFIKKSLSARNVSHVIRLGMNHRDLSLVAHGLSYFDYNAKEVVATTEYKSLMKDDPIYANELISKVINFRYQPEKLILSKHFNLYANMSEFAEKNPNGLVRFKNGP